MIAPQIQDDSHSFMNLNFNGGTTFVIIAVIRVIVAVGITMCFNNCCCGCGGRQRRPVQEVLPLQQVQQVQYNQDMDQFKKNLQYASFNAYEAKQGFPTAMAVEGELGQDVVAMLDMQRNRDSKENCEEENGGGFTFIPPLQNPGSTRLAKDM